MENLSVQKAQFKDMNVYAIVTAGVEDNAMRMSVDEGMFYEPGTINIILLTNMKLSPRAMVRAVITATEAKTAALQDLDVRSSYSPRQKPGDRHRNRRGVGGGRQGNQPLTTQRRPLQTWGINSQGRLRRSKGSRLQARWNFSPAPRFYGDFRKGILTSTRFSRDALVLMMEPIRIGALPISNRSCSNPVMLHLSNRLLHSVMLMRRGFCRTSMPLKRGVGVWVRRSQEENWKHGRISSHARRFPSF